MLHLTKCEVKNSVPVTMEEEGAKLLLSFCV